MWNWYFVIFSLVILWPILYCLGFRDGNKERKKTIDKKVYKYFVSYGYQRDTGYIAQYMAGNGNAVITFHKRISSVDDIREIQSEISQKNNFTSVIITVYQEI